jgi:NTP pyrophosphatase (non-canonical NTP hydrolase)|tara:strand:- start:8356 stop:8712 length:357 start_codon:yes stop_codon:yes gene_type:complete
MGYILNKEGDYMDFNEYQNATRKTAIYPADQGLIYTTLGLTGEAGEVAEKVKKMIRDDIELDDKYRGKIVRELGDVLWYVSNLAHELGVSLDTVAKANLCKLNSRKSRDVIKGDGDER